MGTTVVYPAALADIASPFAQWIDTAARRGFTEVETTIAGVRSTLNGNGQWGDQMTAEQHATLEKLLPDVCFALIRNSGENLGMDVAKITWQVIGATIQAGCDWISLPTWARLTDADHNSQVPTNMGMRDTHHLDDNGQPTTVKMWSEWGDVEHVQLMDGGVQYWYVPLHTSTTPELGSVAMAIKTAGVVVLTQPELNAIQAMQGG